MLMLSNVLALALILADEPKPSQTPTAGTPTLPSVMPKISKPRTHDNPAADVVWHLSLPDAIRIGLENSEVVRVITIGAPDKAPAAGFEPTPFGNGVTIEPPSSPGLVIARVNGNAQIENFKSAIMAHVRSIEQQYWALSQQHIVLWSRETAVRLGEEILRRERAEPETGHGRNADIAEAEQQLENYKLNLVTATSDLITTERQLRNILGLPANDNRRITPATAPTEAKVEPSWNDCVAAMLASQPDIAMQRKLVGIAEFKAIIEGENPALPAEQREASKRELEKQQDFLKQILHQTTHSLARFFLEIDANYKQFQTAQKLRSAAQKRLEAQRAFYEEGRVTIDRLLDAVSQYSNAIAQESLYKTSYNTSIVALEEAKGTLLAYDKITIAEGPAPRKHHVPAKVDQVVPASFDGPASVTPAAAKPVPALYKIKAKLGGEKVLEIEIEVNSASPGR